MLQAFRYFIRLLPLAVFSAFCFSGFCETFGMLQGVLRGLARQCRRGDEGTTVLLEMGARPTSTAEMVGNTSVGRACRQPRAILGAGPRRGHTQVAAQAKLQHKQSYSARLKRPQNYAYSKRTSTLSELPQTPYNTTRNT